MCGCEGILSSTLKFDIFEINGFSVKSIETKGEDVVTKDTKDETNEFKTQFMFKPLPRDYFNLRYTERIKQNPEIKEWIEGEDVVVEKRLKEIKDLNSSKKAEWVKNMNDRKRKLLSKIKSKK